MNDIYWSPGVTLEEVEKQVILKALQYFQGNKTKTAEALDIAVRTVDYKLEKYREQLRGDPRQKIEEETRLSTSTGVRVESSDEDASEQRLPMRKRQKV